MKLTCGFELFNSLPAKLEDCSVAHTYYVGFRVQPPKERSIYAFEFGISKYPTSNCQVSSIAHMDHLITNVKNNRNELKEILTEAYKICKVTPKLVIVDIYTNWIPQVEVHINPAKLLFKNNYPSTNGSNMTMLMFNFESGWMP